MQIMDIYLVILIHPKLKDFTFYHYEISCSTLFLGICHFQVTIEKTAHSKTEIKDDMIQLFSELANEEGYIKVKGFNDYVEQITPDEEKIYENIQEFDPEEIRFF